MMLPASDEQRAIVNAIESSNVIVDSVAGSGKTTTVLHIATTYPNKQILLLTYNSRLRHETRDRMSGIESECNNLEIHTYHSFCVRYIANDCFTDEGINKFLSGTRSLPEFSYDIVVLDECQDMTPVYYKLVQKILASIAGENKLCIIGDKYQSIYGYAGADARFITLADQLYPREFTKLSLSTSYRVTVPMAAFINNILGIPRINAVERKTPSVLPKYTICDTLRPGRIVAEIKTLLRTGFTPSDIFILAPSVKSTNDKNPVKSLANKLSAEGIKIYVPMADDCKLDDDIMKGKLVFSSFHQAKGLERRAVIVLGFDVSYFTFFNKTDPSDRCPNTLFVALTRAKEYLSVYHDIKQQSLSFVDLNEISNLTVMHGKISRWGGKVTDRIKPIAVSKLTDHLSSTVISQCMQMINVTVLRPSSTLIPLPLKSIQIDAFGDSFYEEVSDINGVAIPALYEYRRSGILLGDTIDTVITIPKLLELSNQFISKTSGLNYKIAQISKYDWLERQVLVDSYKRTSEELSTCSTMQMEVETTCNILGYIINGRMDVICDDRVIEIKAVGELQPAHYIQLATYGYCCYIANNSLPLQYKLHLFNIRTNELVEINFCPVATKKMLELLICKKFHAVGTLSDEQFLANLGADIKHLSHDWPNSCDICKLNK